MLADQTIVEIERPNFFRLSEMSTEKISHKLQNLLERANVISKSINAAIDSYDETTVNDLSSEFDDIVSSILSFPIKSITDLKHKCQFGQKLLEPDHNDPELVNNLFTILSQDLDSIGQIVNLSPSKRFKTS